MDIILNDSCIKALYDAQKPKNYAQVSALFKTNYQKISNLIPNLATLDCHHVARGKNTQDLHLFIEHKSPYTGIYTLTHQLQSTPTTINRPNMKFKVYFDAKLLEAISVCNETILSAKHPFLARCSDLDLQWDLNNFVEKWLDYCLEKYHTPLWIKT